MFLCVMAWNSGTIPTLNTMCVFLSSAILKIRFKVLNISLHSIKHAYNMTAFKDVTRRYFSNILRKKCGYWESSKNLKRFRESTFSNFLKERIFWFLESNLEIFWKIWIWRFSAKSQHLENLEKSIIESQHFKIFQKNNNFKIKKQNCLRK